MRLPFIALALVLAALAAGCLQEPGDVTPTPAPVEARYAPGDLLRGDLAGAGLDDPNGTPAGAAILVLEYRPVPGEYVYTLVQPVAEGWAFVFPSGDFVATMVRDRESFESYRLEHAARIDLREVRAPPNGTASPSP